MNKAQPKAHLRGGSLKCQKPKQTNTTNINHRNCKQIHENHRLHTIVQAATFQ